MDLSAALKTKKAKLLSLLEEMKSVAVAFSGGIDSTVVAKAAFLALGDNALAVTADSASVPRSEIADAKQLAQHIGIRHEIVSTEEFDNPKYLQNDGSRCYHCKSELYSKIDDLLPRLSVSFVCSGANVDDQGDYRPGLKAAAEHNIRHPLLEAGFTKADIRALAQDWQIPIWDKPASPCLSSRLAPGLEVTKERTAMIEAGEALLRSLGHRECRIRLHPGEIARIEVPLHELPHLLESNNRQMLIDVLKRLGFQFITLDLEGFRSGSLNTLVDINIKKNFAMQEK